MMWLTSQGVSSAPIVGQRSIPGVGRARDYGATRPSQSWASRRDDRSRAVSEASSLGLKRDGRYVTV